MNSNMKLNVTSDFGRASMGCSFSSGMRQPFGSTKKKAKALARDVGYDPWHDADEIIRVGLDLDVGNRGWIVESWA